MEPLVTVSIPYFRCVKYIRRAVLSILNQTYKNIKVVVINDADFETSPWPVLSDITDPRLIRFDLKENKGPYFATQVVLEAIPTDYLLIQDADDWSHPERISKLLKRLIKDNSDFSFSSTHKYALDSNGNEQYLETLWYNHTLRKPDAQMKWIVPHWGLFKTDSVKNVGGYYGGAKVGYDSFLMNLIFLSGNISFVQMPLYHYYIRDGSLTNHKNTGFNSSFRATTKIKLELLYARIFDSYKKFNSGTITSIELRNQVNYLILTNISSGDKFLLRNEIARMKSLA